jgi:hypothetical protein
MRQMLSAAVIVGLATVVAGAAGYWSTPLRYNASRLVLLMPPTKAGQNPFLFNGNLFRTTDVLVHAARDGAEIAELEEAGVPEGTWTVAPNEQSSAPSVLVEASAETEEIASKRVANVAAQVGAVLRRLQLESDVEADQQLIVDPGPSVVTVRQDNGPRLKMTISSSLAALLVGGACLFVLGRRFLLERQR